MGVRAGRYRHRFKLFTHKLDVDGEPERDEFGALTGNYKVVSNPWCNIIQAKSAESVSVTVAGQETISLELRYSKMLENPETHMYVEFKGDKYDIVSAVDPYMRMEKLELTIIKRR